jgi:hypothetical protein
MMSGSKTYEEDLKKKAVLETAGVELLAEPQKLRPAKCPP